MFPCWRKKFTFRIHNKPSNVGNSEKDFQKPLIKREIKIGRTGGQQKVVSSMQQMLPS